MIIDLHTHVGEYPGHFSEKMLAEARAAWGPDITLGRTLDEHYETTLRVAQRVVVLAFVAPPAGMNVPNDYVADYIKRDPARLVGFGSVDPHDPGAVEEVERMKQDLGLVGCKMGPIYQDVDPLGEAFLGICEALERLELPLLIHQGTTYARSGSLLHARPILIDEIAKRYPNLRIVIAHVGHPWVEEAIVVVRRHPNVYADISALGSRRWQLYQTLLCAVEYGVDHKLLFGTDFPFFTSEQTIDALLSVTGDAFGPSMPTIDEAVVTGIVNRESLTLLGIE
jgi:predicted TIM-barrel fold metal-dependent hydrolase